MDFEIDYANNLMDYMNKRGRLSLQISVFSNTAYFIQYAAHTVVDILLITEDMESEAETLQQYAKNIFLLSEGRYVRENAPHPSIYKYQPAEQVMSEVIDLYVESNHGRAKLQLAVKTKDSLFIGVCSPQGGSSKSTFAMALANYYGKEKKTLYLNLDLFGELSWLFAQDKEYGLSDLLYYVKQRNPNLSLKIAGMVQRSCNMDYIPPVRHYSDLVEMEKEDILYLMDAIETDMDYEIIIMDIGYLHECTLEGLDKCDKLYMTIREDFCSELRKKAFYKQLEEERGKELTDKIKEIQLPYDEIVEKEPNHFLHWLEGSIGTYIMHILEEGEDSGGGYRI